MKNLPKKYIESMMDAQSQIIAQQQEIEQLKEEKLFYSNQWEIVSKENTKLKEEKEALTVVCEKINDYRQEIRILKQYAEIARTDKLHRKGILNDYIRINQQLTDKIVELNG